MDAPATGSDDSGGCPRRARQNTPPTPSPPTGWPQSPGGRRTSPRGRAGHRPTRGTARAKGQAPSMCAPSGIANCMLEVVPAARTPPPSAAGPRRGGIQSRRHGHPVDALARFCRGPQGGPRPSGGAVRGGGPPPTGQRSHQGIVCTWRSPPLQELLTLPQECFAPFNRFTCPLSARGGYPALAEIHLSRHVRAAGPRCSSPRGQSPIAPTSIAPMGRTLQEHGAVTLHHSAIPG